MRKSGGEIPVPFAKELNDLVRRLVAAAKEAGREEALSKIRAAVSGDAAPRRGPGRPRGNRNKAKAAVAKSARPRSAIKRKSSWAGLSPAQHLARVNAIRKGRGLPVKEKL